MTTEVTIQLALKCETGALPVAALEVLESPDSVRTGRSLQVDAETTVQVLEGVVYVASDDDAWVLTAGDSATLGSGTAYQRWNAGEDYARWVEFYCAA